MRNTRTADATSKERVRSPEPNSDTEVRLNPTLNNEFVYVTV